MYVQEGTTQPMLPPTSARSPKPLIPPSNNVQRSTINMGCQAAPDKHDLRCVIALGVSIPAIPLSTIDPSQIHFSSLSNV